MLISLFELLPALIPFALLWHAGWILDKNVNMNMNYSYQTTMYESILERIYVFLVFHLNLFITWFVITRFWI